MAIKVLFYKWKKQKIYVKIYFEFLHEKTETRTCVR